MTLDVRKSPSRGGIVIRDNATRESVFVEWEQALRVALSVIDLHDRERQANDRSTR